MTWIRVPMLAVALLASACASGESPQDATDAASRAGESGTTPATSGPGTVPRPNDGRTPAAPSPAAPAPSVAGPTVGAVADPPGGGDAASRLRANPECDVGSQPVARLAWRPAQQRGAAQVVVVSAFANGFKTGNYQSSPRLAADAASFNWSETTANTSYRWRVMTLHGDTWTPSEIGSFVGPQCGVEDTS